MNRRRADALLLLVALIWGTTFVVQKQVNAHIGPLLFVALRFLAAAAFLLPLCLRESARWRAASTEPMTRRDWLAALAISLCLCAGCWSQQIGLQTSTATNAGFLTAVYIALVPFVAWTFSRRPPRPIVLLACFVALSGAWLLAGGADFSHWTRGDIIILSSDLLWALHITLVGHFRALATRPFLLSFVQCAVTGLVSLPVALALEPLAADGLRAALGAIVYAGVLSSGLAFTFQILGQRHTPAPEAALILCLESVFAAIAAAWLLGEAMSARAWAGAALILMGATLVEIGPLAMEQLTALAKRRLRPAPEDAP